MTVNETIDAALDVKNHTYTVTDKKETYLLKTIHIPKTHPFSYAFLGGMWYSKKQFAFNDETISLPYPFTSYYTIKILDKTINEQQSKSTIYVKMPVCVIQCKETCYLIEFDPVINLDGKDIFPFIQLKETEKSYDISFYLCTRYTIKQKEEAWLGRGTKKEIHHPICPPYTFQFYTNLLTFSNWNDAITSYLKKHISSTKHNSLKKDPATVFSDAKHALWRSYDHQIGTFLQLPWRETPGFTFVNSSYSLVSYDAVRLDYFSKWYQQSKDDDFKHWMKKLHNLFLQPELHTTPKKKGNGLIWYNMTTLTKKGLTGYFYMDTGYAGYPGGQATVDLHLLCYLNRYPDKQLEHLVKQSIRYLLSTQNEDGSWPMAIKQQGKLKFRPEQLKNYATHGGTAESIRALLKASEFFNNKEMKNAAEKGLAFLIDDHPICYNGLRDIGIMEPEAFSAVSVINAFLDAYDIEEKEIYLKTAQIYADYTLPWIYHWHTKQMPFTYGFHPISYSITPRLSPYETAWIISTYQRLFHHSEKSYLLSLNKQLFNHVIEYISHTGGLSEGVFPAGFTGFKRLPMEQTFATVELMNSATTFMEHGLASKQPSTEKSATLDDSFQLFTDQHLLILKKDKKILFTFDAKQGAITTIADSALEEEGIFLSFHGANKKAIRRTIIKQLRGNIGKYVISGKDATYAITGVKGPKPEQNVHIDPIKHHIKSSELTLLSSHDADVIIILPHHHLHIHFDFLNEDESLHILMTIIISVTTHDLPIKQQIFFPVISAKPRSKTEKNIMFDGFSIKGDMHSTIQHSNYTAIDQTLSSNWTHGGICKKEFQINISFKE